MRGLGLAPSDLATPALRQAFHGMTFKSQLTPEIYIDDPFGPTPPSLIGSIVRPQVTLHSKLGSQVIEPWGAPQDWVFPVAFVTVAAILVGIGYSLGRRR
jgi:hypothetical protein